MGLVMALHALAAVIWVGGMAGADWHIHAVQGLGMVMILLYVHVYFAPCRRLK